METPRFSRRGFWRGGLLLAVAIALFSLPSVPADAQVNTAKPITVKTKTPKANAAKFAGTVLHANIAQITVRGKDNEMVVRTFPLSKELSEQMQKIVDSGGYQYGDKVIVTYDPVSNAALKIKGKPSKPI